MFETYLKILRCIISTGQNEDLFFSNNHNVSVKQMNNLNINIMQHLTKQRFIPRQDKSQVLFQQKIILNINLLRMKKFYFKE